jgi:cell division protein FtsB
MRGALCVLVLAAKASSMFWLGVVETAIGAALGFGLGLAAFHYQSRNEQREKLKLEKVAANDALFRTMQAAVLNVEALASAKLQLLAQLPQESSKMKELIERFYQADDAGKLEVLPQMREAANHFTTFFMTIPKPSSLEPPDFNELTLIVREMPVLTTFIHRGVSVFHEVVERIEDRNKLIAEYVVANDQIMSDGRFVYFMSMLSGLADAICIGVDDDMAFFMLVKEQAENYLSSSNVGGEYRIYEIAEAARPYLPADDRFAALKAQIKQFE